MKTWETAELVELEISATAQGGKDIDNIDAVWTDKLTGDAWLSCGSGGNAGGDEITVIK